MYTCTKIYQLDLIPTFKKNKVKVLLILPWIAASTNEVGFHVGPAYPSPASASTARCPLQLGIGWSNVSEVPCSRKPNHYSTSVASHSPVDTAGSTGAMWVKFLAQGNNRKQHCLGIESGSPGSKANHKLLGPCRKVKVNVKDSEAKIGIKML